MRRISIGINWQGGFDMDSVVEQAKLADDSGVDSIFVAEAWGRDAFTTLAVLARETRNVKLGTSIVNIFSRTPAALAQHFATLDELSGGRMIIGLGASGPNVIEDFHGIKFERPLTRMREYVDIINILNRGERLNYDGHFFQLGRGFTLRDVNLVRDHIPIYIASLTPKSVQLTAAIADGWFPIYVPRHQWTDQVETFQQYVRAAGRDPEEVTIRSAATVSVTDEPERTYQGIASTTSFYIARMGDFYYEHFVRMGYADEANAVRAAWRDGGAEAGAEAIPEDLRHDLGVGGSVEECAEWLDAAEEAGYRLHGVNVQERDPQKRAEIYRSLVG
jgi:F420-dependent oxidoreductase-like protein